MADKGPHSQGYGLSSSHVQKWELDHKEGRVPKNWSFQTVVLEKILESPLDSKEIKPVNPKGNQPWILIGMTDAEVEAPILWPPDANNQLIGKDPDDGKDWRQKKRETEDEMVGWHHWVNGHELGQTLGEDEGLGAWHTALHGVTKSQTRLATEQQQQVVGAPPNNSLHNTLPGFQGQQWMPETTDGTKPYIYLYSSLPCTCISRINFSSWIGTIKD